MITNIMNPGNRAGQFSGRCRTVTSASAPAMAAGGALEDRPGGWSSYTFWQTSSAGPFPGDQDIFNSSSSQLLQFAASGAIPRLLT